MGNEHIILEVYKEGHLIIYLEYYADDDAWTQAVPFFKKAGEDLMARATQGVFDLKKKVLAEYFWIVRSSSN